MKSHCYNTTSFTHVSSLGPSRFACRLWQQVMHTTNGEGEDVSRINTCARLQQLLPASKEFILLSLSIGDLAHLLQECGRRRDHRLALHLYHQIHGNGLDTHNLLGNYLIPMLVDVGQLDDARKVFYRVADCNEWPWNSLINGYVKCGNPQEALKLYQKMRKCTTVQRDGHTFVAALKACTMLRDLGQGALIHEEIAEIGLLNKNLFVANTVIDMYAKCGSLANAQQVFDRLPRRTIVSWNALIAGYAEDGQDEEALRCLEKMQLYGVLPNAITFLCALKACGSFKAAKEGGDIHMEIERQGLMESHPHIGTALVDMYSKCGLLGKAQEVFNKLQVQDVVSWTALITGYAERGHGLQAILCFEQMQREGVAPNAVTFVSALKACAMVGAVENGQEIHAMINHLVLIRRDILVSTALIDMYSKLGLHEKAQQVFDKLPARDIISWNTLVAGYAEHGHGERTIQCFEQMLDDGVMPDEVTYICTLKACGSMRDIKRGQEIHQIVESQGLLERNLAVGNTLVDMYVKCGLLLKAQQAFNNLKQRDVVTWTSLMVGYTENGQDEEALECFDRMQTEGIPPNTVTFLCCLKACGNIVAMDKGVEIHAEIERQGLLERDPVVGTTLVDMYAKCGLLANAHQVFHRLPSRDGVCWTALMSAHAHLGETSNAIWVFDKMLKEGIEPNVVTFVVLLSVCCQGCLLHRSQTYFEAMSKDFGIAPTVEHLTCMVSLLGRSGLFERADAVIKLLPVCLDSVAWNTMLGMCRHLGSLELGKHAFKHVLQSSSKM